MRFPRRIFLGNWAVYRNRDRYRNRVSTLHDDPDPDLDFDPQRSPWFRLVRVGIKPLKRKNTHCLFHPSSLILHP